MELMFPGAVREVLAGAGLHCLAGKVVGWELMDLCGFFWLPDLQSVYISPRT